MQNISFRHFQGLFMSTAVLALVMLLAACGGTVGATGQSTALLLNHPLPRSHQLLPPYRSRLKRVASHSSAR